jgi:hypothetical protein
MRQSILSIACKTSFFKYSATWSRQSINADFKEDSSV